MGVKPIEPILRLPPHTMVPLRIFNLFKTLPPTISRLENEYIMA